MDGFVTIYSISTEKDWKSREPYTSIDFSISYDDGQIISTKIKIPLIYSPSRTEIMRYIKDYFKGNLIYKN